MKEEWKPISGFEELYEVSNLGRIKSIARLGTKGGVITNHNNGGYLKAHLYKNGKQYDFFIHRLVAIAFIPKVNGKTEINHKNGNKLDNTIDNLEWCNRSENISHAVDNGLRKLKRVGQYKNGILIKEYCNCYRASKESGINYNSIYWCIAGIYKQAGGYEWKYL